MPELDEFLSASASQHSHLCPRQVLGVRAAILAARVLALDVPRRDKRLLVITETDGCFTDGLRAVTGVSVGHRTLRVEDYGKIAATFIDVKTEKAIRLAPRVNVRQRAWDYTPDENRRYFSQLRAYQIMPADELFSIHAVRLRTPLEEIISRPGIRTNCDLCGEEIINEREVEQDGRTLCRSCAGASYYISVEELDTINLKT
jgi:formylmethanofuran dehydrogenase subunit E